MFIAEIGINHQGSYEIAKQLIDVAKESGADVVKFQKRNPDICVPEKLKNTIKDSIFGKMNYLEYKKRIEFDKSTYDKIDRYCKEINMPWTASVWDKDSLEFLMQYDVPFIKIPSALLTDTELLKKTAEYHKPIVISNGMSYEKDVEAAVEILKDCPLSILCCNSTYPTLNYNELDLDLIPFYKQKYPFAKIGYSGHEVDILPSIVAYAMGAEIIERHITLDRSLPGADHKASLEPKAMRDLIKIMRLIDEMKNTGKAKDIQGKVPYESELFAKRKLRGD